ncbi:MAG: molybdenum cofactor guanylyltransferase [Planctomycetota bacterium]|nr:molybdenum cofactor guanylyltransferase [Planctomycetota bacterium]MDA1250725.1 molybdenum cofactor guanylyltransferase [Planctomycetota bacterium]
MFEPKRQSGGVVLCGGKSSRMGQPKHSLPIGDELLLQRVCRILAEIVSPIIVVAAVDQDLPPLPDSIRIVRDEFDSLGPLAGIATGLAALQADCDSAFVTSCDVPLLKPEFVRAIIEKLGSHDVAVPSDGKYDHVLAAAYRTNLGLTARELLTAGQRRPLRLIESSNSLRIPVNDLRQADPNLDSLRNANTQEEYEAILKLL